MTPVRASAMTSRMDELRQGLPHVDSVVSDGGGDIEGGLDPESERLMTRFNKEADAIRNVLDWSRDTVTEIDGSFDIGHPSASPERLAEAVVKLDQVEDKLSAVRKRLKRIAGENKDFKRNHSDRTAVTRTRVVQYKQMGERFINITKDLERVRGKHRDAMSRSVRQDIMHANPGMSARDADDAMAAGDQGLESVMHADRAETAERRYQVEDIKNRNAEIHKLTKNMTELHTMFVDMSILVEGQQELLNNIEYNVEEVKGTTQKATEELVLARRHQKAKNKKKCWCVAICILVVVAAVVGIVVGVGKKAGWFDGSGGDSNASRRTVVAARYMAATDEGDAATAVGAAVSPIGNLAVETTTARDLGGGEIYRQIAEVNRRGKSFSLRPARK